MTKHIAARVTVAVLALLLIVFAVDVVLLVFASILLAIALRALAEPVAKRFGIPEPWAVGIVVALLVVLFSGVGWAIAPAIGEQATQLRSALPDALQRLQQELSRFVWLESLFDSAPHSDAPIAQEGVASTVTNAVSGTLSAIANTAFVLVVAIYLAVDPRLYVEGVVRLFPPARRDRTRAVLHTIGTTLRWWLIGKGLSMILVGIAAFIGLLALKVPLAAALALIAALLDFIPNVGPILAVVPAALFALLQGPTQVAYVVALYAAIQVIEGYLLTPLIEQRTVSVPPALSLTAMLVAALLFGWLGLLLAAPATAALLVLVRMVYLEDTLGERQIIPARPARQARNRRP